jgi:hypothetical protein
MSELRKHPRICDRYLITPRATVFFVSGGYVSCVARSTTSPRTYLRSVSLREKLLEHREHLKGLIF